jgi:hypothetical protein
MGFDLDRPDGELLAPPHEVSILEAPGLPERAPDAEAHHATEFSQHTLAHPRRLLCDYPSSR